jgi:hypothetical protein
MQDVLGQRVAGHHLAPVQQLVALGNRPSSARPGLAVQAQGLQLGNVFGAEEEAFSGSCQLLCSPM